MKQGRIVRGPLPSGGGSSTTDPGSLGRGGRVAAATADRSPPVGIPANDPPRPQSGSRTGCGKTLGGRSAISAWGASGDPTRRGRTEGRDRLSYVRLHIAARQAANSCCGVLAAPARQLRGGRAYQPDKAMVTGSRRLGMNGAAIVETVGRCWVDPYGETKLRRYEHAATCSRIG